MSVRHLISLRMREAARLRRRAESPAELARHLDPRFVVTPTIWLLSFIAVRAIMQPDQRDVVSTPPRTGKSETVVVWTIVWALMMNPDLLIIVAAYGDDLAEEHSRKARKLITEHSAYLGYCLSPDKTAVKRWTVQGHRGGVLAAGIQSGITGMGADLLLIDDPLKGQADADSPTIRRKILSEYRSTLAPRVHPGGSIAVIQCIMASMRVMTSDGRWVPIKDVPVGERVTALDPVTGAMSAGTVSATRLSGRDETLVVSTDRHDLRVNARHPFAVMPRGGGRDAATAVAWKRAGDLQVGDVVVTVKAATELATGDPVVSLPTEFASSARRSKVAGLPHSDIPGVSWNSAYRKWKVSVRVNGEIRFGGYFDVQADAEEKALLLRADMTEDHVIDVDRAWLIGYMIGDGWVTLHRRKNQGGSPVSGCVCIALSDKPHFDERAWKELQRWSPNTVYETPGRYMRTDWSAGARLLSGVFGLGKGAGGKRVPEVVWSWPTEHRVAFLEGYCAADGTKLPRMKDGWRCASVSRDLIEDVRLLALTCGVRPGRIVEFRGTFQPPNSPEPVESVCYSVLLAFQMYGSEGASIAGVEHPDPEHIRYERIRSITRDGEVHDVYDLTVEGAGNFVAEGFVVHNTRWHEKDLAGSLLEQEPDVWRHTNIPAVSEAGVPDALGRPPGVAMVSALGFTADHFAAMRRTSGERSWYALYMGVPSTPEGGLVKAKWLRDWRMPMAPASPVLTVVGVDPSDSGQGDSCGLVAAASTREGVVALIADVSAPMTSDQWARAAVDLAVEVGASEIAVEGFAARETYTRVVRDAIKRAKVGRPIRVSSWPPKGSGRGGGDAIARSAALLQALEVGTARLAGHFPEFEAKATAWQVGQHQPDSLAAFVVAHDVLVHAAGAVWQLAAPPGVGPGGGGSVTGLDWARQRIS